MTGNVASYFEELEASEDLGRLAKRGGIASVAGVYGNGILQVIGIIVLARLLTPEDFGLAALVIIFSRFAPLLIDCGMTDAMTQKSKISQGQISALFWLNSGIGFAVAAVLAASGPLMVWLYHDERLQSIALYSAITYVFTGIAVQHMALLRRSMKFVEIAKIQFLSALAGVVIAVVLAKAGYGYWALVFRPIVSAACIVAGAWLVCRWTPGLPVFDAEVKSMLHFGMHVLGFTIPYSTARILDRVVLGIYYSPREVGYYQNAQNMYENAFLSPIAQLHGVGSASLAKLRSDPGALRQKYETTLSALAFFVMAAAAILSVTGQDLAVALLGETWRRSGLLLSILALRGIVEFIELSQGWLHVASGNANRWKNSGIANSIVFVVAILAGLPYGAEGVTIAIVASCWLVAFPTVLYAGRPLGIGAALVFRAVGAQLLGAIVTVAAGWWLEAVLFAGFSPLSRILLSSLLCSSIYLAIVVGFFRKTEPVKIAWRLGQNFGTRSRGSSRTGSATAARRFGIARFVALGKFRASDTPKP
jgi:PST family polysaccharide transporter